MAETTAMIAIDAPPESVFALMTDPETFGDWLVFHDSWRGAPPAADALRAGLKVATVINVKGQRMPFDWKIDAYSPPAELRFSGKEKGVKVAIDLRVVPAGAGSSVSFRLELGGLPAMGPIGKAAVRQLHDDVEESLEQLRGLS